MRRVMGYCCDEVVVVLLLDAPPVLVVGRGGKLDCCCNCWKNWVWAAETESWAELLCRGACGIGDCPSRRDARLSRMIRETSRVMLLALEEEC